MNQQTHFFELLTHLTAHENQSVNEQCWRGLGERALRFAYTHDSFREINKLLMNAPPEINKRLVSWFKRLGIKVVPHSATKGGWRATAVEDRKRQNEMCLAAKTLPFNTTVVIVNKDTDKPWFDDLEQESRNHSVHAYQGGKVSGK